MTDGNPCLPVFESSACAQNICAMEGLIQDVGIYINILFYA